jgi:hypothetical protein
MLSPPHLQQNQKLVTIAGFNNMTTPVINNSTSIKNYSQVVPKWGYFQKTLDKNDLPLD